jgi:hypothetical protein
VRAYEDGDWTEVDDCAAGLRIPIEEAGEAYLSAT